MSDRYAGKPPRRLIRLVGLGVGRNLPSGSPDRLTGSALLKPEPDRARAIVETARSGP